MKLYNKLHNGGGGAGAVAQYHVIKSAQDFKDNSQNSKGPGGKGVVPDKQYAISNYESVDDCINGPTGLVSLGVDTNRARQECESYFGDKLSNSEQKTVGGASWVTPKIESKPCALMQRGEGKRLAVANKLKSASERIAAETKARYSQASGKTMNANVNSNRVPAWVKISNIDVSHLHNATSTTNIKSAKEEREDGMYNYMITQMGNHKDSVNYVPPNLELENMIYQKGEGLRQAAQTHRVKSGKREYNPYSDMPAWYIISGGVL